MNSLKTFSFEPFICFEIEKLLSRNYIEILVWGIQWTRKKRYSNENIKNSKFCFVSLVEQKCISCKNLTRFVQKHFSCKRSCKIIQSLQDFCMSIHFLQVSSRQYFFARLFQEKHFLQNTDNMLQNIHYLQKYSLARYFKNFARFRKDFARNLFFLN